MFLPVAAHGKLNDPSWLARETGYNWDERLMSEMVPYAGTFPGYLEFKVNRGRIDREM
jgi:hypothetical protein